MDTTKVEGGICRACSSFCPGNIEIDNGRTVSFKPVKNHPVYHGYACARGRASHEFAYTEGRLLSSMKRQPDGGHTPIGSADAIREVADIIRHTLERHGPRSVAVYTGTMGALNTLPRVFSEALLTAIKSPMSFHSNQIDQPGKPISAALHGRWLAGHANLDQADAWLAIGINPAISMFGPPNPAHAIKRARTRGARLFVIDPRRTELAQQADIFLQIAPGQDAEVLAGLIHVVLAEGLQDQAFLDDNVRGLEQLRNAVAPFTPEFVANRTGINAEQLVAMARGYAASKSGVVFAGTGPNMSPHGTLMEYLRLSLMTICGHWRKAGEPVAAQGVLVNLLPALAQATDPVPQLDRGVHMRVRNLSNTACGMPTSALAEEILLEGEGQVRVLIVSGGNPMAAWPDQLRTHEAMKKLDLLVCVDPVMSDTGKYAHYVIAPKVMYETMNTSVILEMAAAAFPVYRPIESYAANSPALVAPPPGSDVIEEWEFYYGVARHLDLSLSLKPVSFLFDPVEAQKRAVELDMQHKPTTEALWDLLLAGSPVPFDNVKPYATGKVFDLPAATVQPKAAGWTGKLDIGNSHMMEDLQRAYIALAEQEAKGFRFKMIGRRLKDRFNSSWRIHDVCTRHWSYNPAFMHPDDLSALGIAQGDVVKIESRRGTIKGVIEAEPTLRRGVIAMTHAWGGNPDSDADPLAEGANVGVLTDNTVDYDPYSAMPRMSAIPVNVVLAERRDADK